MCEVLGIHIQLLWLKGKNLTSHSRVDTVGYQWVPRLGRADLDILMNFQEASMQ
jgi:hypothetical protein